MNVPLRVLIVDDSAVMRNLIGKIVGAAEGLVVAGGPLKPGRLPLGASLEFDRAIDPKDALVLAVNRDEAAAVAGFASDVASSQSLVEATVRPIVEQYPKLALSITAGMGNPAENRDTLNPSWIIYMI